MKLPSGKSSAQDKQKFKAVSKGKLELIFCVPCIHELMQDK